MTVHENSLLAFAEIRVSPTELRILGALAATLQPATDAECGMLLNLPITSIRPRLSGLKAKGMIAEVMNVEETGRATKVRCSIITTRGRRHLERSKVVA